MNNSIQDVKTEHEARLMQLPGVVSVGIGKNDTGDLSIIVGIEKDDATIKSRIPDKLEGYPVKIQTLGNIYSQ